MVLKVTLQDVRRIRRPTVQLSYTLGKGAGGERVLRYNDHCRFSLRSIVAIGLRLSILPGGVSRLSVDGPRGRASRSASQDGLLT